MKIALVVALVAAVACGPSHKSSSVQRSTAEAGSGSGSGSGSAGPVVDASIPDAPAPAPPPIPVPTPPPTVASCEVPLAIPNDGLDDRLAIQNACAAQKCAHLRAGQYDIDTPSFTPPARRPYAMIASSGCEIFGEGAPFTTVKFRGSAGGAEWQAFTVTGAHPWIHDFTYDDAAITNTVEQTHGIRVIGPAISPRVSRMTFNHPVRANEKGGDCVQFVCYPNTPCSDGLVDNNLFTHCDRSGVAAHSGVHGLVIEDNAFPDTGNTGIDFEGTGDTTGVIIRNNRFAMSSGLHGVGEIQLQLVSHARVTGNTFIGRGIDVFQSDDVEFDHNVIDFTQGTGYAVFNVEKDSSHINVHHNTLTREAIAGDGQIIRAVPHGSGTPDHLTISDNVLVQHATGDVINASGVSGLYVEHNTVTYDGGPGVSFLVQANGSSGESTVRTTDILVNSNIATGRMRAMVAFSGSYAGAGTVLAGRNYSPGIVGVMCGNANVDGTIWGPLTVTGNAWLPPVCSMPFLATPLQPLR